MKYLLITLLSLFSTQAHATDCTVFLQVSTPQQNENSITELVKKRLIQKGYQLADNSNEANYNLDIGPIIYDYLQGGGPLSWIYEEGYVVILSSITNGNRSYDSNKLLYKKEIDSLVLFKINFAKMGLKKALKKIPTCEAIQK